jgi:hypothetical protein
MSRRPILLAKARGDAEYRPENHHVVLILREAAALREVDEKRLVTDRAAPHDSFGSAKLGQTLRLIVNSKRSCDQVFDLSLHA